MRKLLVLLFFALLTACGGSDAADTTSSTTAADTSSTDAALVALPPLSSVPVSEYGTQHVEPPVSFATSPSTGGNHYQFWQNCGFYTEQAIEGAATHTLEHGAVWITYNKSAVSSDDLAILETLSADNGKLLISPYEHDEAIVLSAWGVQQRGVPAPTTPDGIAAINSFVAAWADNPELKEAGVTCVGSLGVPPEDVRSFADGQKVPDVFE